MAGSACSVVASLLGPWLAGSALVWAGCTLSVRGEGRPLGASDASVGGGGNADSGLGTGGSGLGSGGQAGGAGGVCPGAIEICNNGIDDNCDALIDCEDPTCGHYECTPENPTLDWSLVAFFQDSQVEPCPSPKDTPLKVVEGIGKGGDFCSCECGAPDKNPCTQGTVTLKLAYTTDIGCAYCIDSEYSIPVDGECNKLPESIPGECSPGIDWEGGKASSVAVTPVPCESFTKLPDATFAHRGQLCALSAVPGAGCKSHNAVCLPKPGLGTWCLKREGEGVACPSTHPDKHVVYESVEDARACPSCCTSRATACSNPKLWFYNDQACKVQVAWLEADGSCHHFDDDPGNSQYAKYTADPNATDCQAGESKVTGDLKGIGPKTICCP